MRTFEVEAAAKINLSLDVTGIRSDGYHLLRSVMQTITLKDRLRVTISDGPSAIRLTADKIDIPLDNRNTCYRAAEAWMDRSGNNYSILIDIEKNIPSEAGLGGGSADAAAVINALNKMAGNPLTKNKLVAAALQTGADVPFCLQGGIALCEGIGEVVTPLPAMPARPLLLLKPGFGLSTPAVYKQLDQMLSSAKLDHEQILAAVRAGDWEELGQTSGNMLEQAALILRPELADYLERVRQTNPVMSMMTGSGTCIFAVYNDNKERSEAATVLTSVLKTDDLLMEADTN